MDKRLLISLVILIIVVPIAYSLTNIVVEETELVSLKPSFDDPDGDRLELSYSYPLNDEGEWQTNYGDEGNYIVAVTASDGELITEEEVIIVVEKKEEPPEIYDFYPQDIFLSVEEGESLHFDAIASDLNKDELTYKWYFDDDVLGRGQEIEYFADYFDQGTHTIKVVVSDGTLDAAQEWTVDIEDVDRTYLLGEIPAIEVDELDIVSLELPEFEAYNLEYDISEPIGNNNFWETTYDDSGEYIITVKIMDRGFESSRRINVIVNDIDREPTFDEIYNRAVREGEEVIISADIDDPDGDVITISVLDAPEGSEFRDGVFRWTPDRDFVRKTNFYTNLLDKLHLLRKTQAVTFLGESKGISISRTVKIRVLDDNRAPTLEEIGSVIVNEGETIFLEPNAYDLDGDKVSYRYSGWMNKPIRETNFDDAGTHTVTVRASDGKSTVEKDLTITVNDVNRPPVIYEIPKQDVNEREALQFSINTNDPDGNQIITSVENAPDDSGFYENAFTWTPGYDETRKLEVKEYTVTFTASDGKLNSSRNAVIHVHNSNRALQILNVSPIMGEFSVYAGSSVLFQVLASDPDGDRLSYEWVFGPLQRYKTGPLHSRKFMIPGKKEVIAVISDGEAALSVKWIVYVVKPATLPQKVVASTPTTQPEPVTQEPVTQQEPTPQPVPQTTPQPAATTPTYSYTTYVVTERV